MYAFYLNPESSEKSTTISPDFASLGLSKRMKIVKEASIKLIYDKSFFLLFISKLLLGARFISLCCLHVKKMFFLPSVSISKRNNILMIYYTLHIFTSICKSLRKKNIGLLYKTILCIKKNKVKVLV